jgi:hypothetical protein
MSGTVWIPLTQDKFTQIDIEDLAEVIDKKWKYEKIGYAGHSYRKSSLQTDVLLLHRHILRLSRGDGMVVRHKNGNRLDNRRSNLRVLESQTAARSREKRGKYGVPYRGVSHAGKGWQANIRVEGQPLYLGYFTNQEDAATAYNFAVEVHHGPAGAYNRVPQPWLEELV